MTDTLGLPSMTQSAKLPNSSFMSNSTLYSKPSSSHFPFGMQRYQSSPAPSSTSTITVATTKSPSPLLSREQLNRPAQNMSASTNSSSTSTASTITVMDPPRKKLDISNLMSPPEPARYENFSEGDAAGCQSKAPQPKMPTEPMPSPPISPDTPMHDIIHTATTASPGSIQDTVEVAVKDPILYPSTQDASQGAPPLFGPEHPAQVEHNRVIDSHLAARSQNLWVMAPSPDREDYQLVLSFKSVFMPTYSKDRRAWLRREHWFLKKDRDAKIAALEEKKRPKTETTPSKPRFANILPAKSVSTQVPQEIKPSRSAARQNRVTKPAPKPRPIRSSGNGNGTAIGSSSSSSSSSALAKSSPGAKSTPEPPAARRTVAPNREDKDFNALPDYSPPKDRLPNKPNSLKVEWKGLPIDLSADPNRNLLHPDERQLAATLRLDCATYLTSKRRLFIRRVECAKTGKEFRKTDAQQACKIDVNKASKLWTAFEKVGWLDKDLVAKHL